MFLGKGFFLAAIDEREKQTVLRRCFTRTAVSRDAGSEATPALEEWLCEGAGVCADPWWVGGAAVEFRCADVGGVTGPANLRWQVHAGIRWRRTFA